jgi:hypothetical protein
MNDNGSCVTLTANLRSSKEKGTDKDTGHYSEKENCLHIRSVSIREAFDGVILVLAAKCSRHFLPPNALPRHLLASV